MSDVAVDLTNLAPAVLLQLAATQARKGRERLARCLAALAAQRLAALRDDEVGARWSAFRPAGMREPCDTLGIDWVIVGGESGPGHRPMAIEWARALRDQCRTAGVPFFFKQISVFRSGQGVDALGEVVQEFPESGRAPAAPGGAG